MTAPIARVATALVTALSALGLLCTRLGVFDDSALMMGGRLVAAGKLPYLDFHTLYGPLGYTLTAALLEVVGNPGVALRLGQILMLSGVAVTAHVVANAIAGRDGELWVPPAVLAISAAIATPPYLGVGFSLIGLMFYVLAARADGRGGAGWAAAGGLALAAAGLVRPAFAVDVAGALLAMEAVLAMVRGLRRLRTVAVFLSAAAGGTVFLWVGLYRRIPVGDAWEAAFDLPRRLLAGRYLEPRFLQGPVSLALAAGAALFLMASLWALTRPGARFAAGSGALIAAVLPLGLKNSRHPIRDAALVALVLFLLQLFLVFREAPHLAKDPLLEAAAFFSLAAFAFGNYFWVRADRQHLVPALAFASVGAVLVMPRLRVPGRVGTIVLFLAGFLGLVRETGQPAVPAVSLASGGAADGLANARRPGAGPATIWPAGEVPAHAVAAVRLADEQGDPGSRFVAVASSHGETSGNPVYLFLISRRLPYSKWYTYDPGVQSSPEVQAQMTRELVRSGSRAAVVWRAEQFRYGGSGAAAVRDTPFDAEFRRLYPRVLGRFGNYEVRARP